MYECLTFKRKYTWTAQAATIPVDLFRNIIAHFFFYIVSERIEKCTRILFLVHLGYYVELFKYTFDHSKAIFVLPFLFNRVRTKSLRETYLILDCFKNWSLTKRKILHLREILYLIYAG